MPCGVADGAAWLADDATAAVWLGVAGGCFCCCWLAFTMAAAWLGWTRAGKEMGEAGLHEYLRHKTVTKASSGFSWNWFGGA